MCQFVKKQSYKRVCLLVAVQRQCQMWYYSPQRPEKMRHRNHSTGNHKSMNHKAPVQHKNKQNSKQPFNTRGYFDPQLPHDQQYIQAKQKAFQKYRKEQEGYVMLTAGKSRGALIQRGCRAPLKEQDQSETENKGYLNAATISLVKNYFLRKERLQVRNNERFADPPNIRTEILYPKTANISRVCSHALTSHATYSTQLPSITDF